MKKTKYLLLAFLFAFVWTFQLSLPVFAKNPAPAEKPASERMLKSSALASSLLADGDPALPNSVTVENDVFLHGKYIEVGISGSGSFGTEENAPDGFHPTEGGLGFIADDDGFDTGNAPIAGDYFLPGDPEEGFTVGYRTGNETGDTYNFTNVERNGIIGIPSTTTDFSSGDTLAAKTVGTTRYYNEYSDGMDVYDYAYATEAESESGKLKVEQFVSFGVNDKYFKNTITLTNLTVAETLFDVRYMRSFDPDQDASIYSNYYTQNAVIENPPQQDRAIVRALGAETGAPMFLLSFDNDARASAFDFTNRNPYAPDAYNEDGSVLLGDRGTVDESITMTFAPGNLTPGQSVTFTYYTSLNGDLDEGMEEIEHEVILSDNTVYENSVSGTAIGTLSTRAPEETGTHTYSLVDNADGRFMVEGDVLKVADGSLLDYDDADSHSITVRISCSRTEKSYDKTFTIGVLEDTVIRLEVDSTRYQLTVGQTHQTVVSMVYSSEEIYNVTNYSIYTSNNPGVASVNKTGLVTAANAGTTVIQAVYNEVYSAPINVTVVPVVRPSHDRTSRPSRTKIGEEIGSGGKLLRSIYEDDLNVKGNTYRIDAKATNDVHKFILFGSFITKQYSKNPKTIMQYGTETGDYSLPLGSISFADISKELGISQKDINLSVSISKILDKNIKSAEDEARSFGATMIFGLMDYRIEVGNSSGKKKELKDLGLYLSRTIKLGSAVNPGSTVGVMYDPETKKFLHTPTLFTTSGSKSNAELKRYGNSMYTILHYSKSFDDLNGHWSKAEVEKLASKIIVKGKTEGSYDPDANVTRAEFTAMVIRALGIPEEKDGSDFTDISDQWYAGAVNSAFKLGLIKGYDDGTFKPASNITRAEMAMVIYRALNFADAKVNISNIDQSLSRFGDRGDIASLFREAVAADVEAGIIKGDDKGNFNPHNGATRAEAAAMTIRMMNYLKFIN